MVIVGACGCLGLTGCLWLLVGVCGCLWLTGCAKYICAHTYLYTFRFLGSRKPSRYKILDVRYQVLGTGY